MDRKIFVRRQDAIKKRFKGVSLDSLAVGEKSMGGWVIRPFALADGCEACGFGGYVYAAYPGKQA
nr:hypothetical protein [uncultured Duncaniella sp.]